jgi:hypothetical protein
MINMTYIEIKTVYGRQYKYLRKAVRIGEKVRHINLKYLGPANPVYKIKQKRKSNASVYIHQLKDSEIKELTNLQQSQRTLSRENRAKNIASLIRKDISPEKSQKEIGCGVRKARNAIKAFNGARLKALERRKPKGAQQKFTNAQRAKIIMTVYQDPTIILGMPFTTWSLRKLKRYLIDKKIVDYISIFTIRKILKAEGMSIRKSKRFQYSNDPKFDKKKNF